MFLWAVPLLLSPGLLESSASAPVRLEWPLVRRPASASGLAVEAGFDRAFLIVYVQGGAPFDKVPFQFAVVAHYVAWLVDAHSHDRFVEVSLLDFLDGWWAFPF